MSLTLFQSLRQTKVAIIIMKDMAQMSKNVIVHQENSSLPQANRCTPHIFTFF